jgi:hypothetical protein
MSANDPKRTYWRQVSVILRRTLFSRALDFWWGVSKLLAAGSLDCAPQTYPKSRHEIINAYHVPLTAS